MFSCPYETPNFPVYAEPGGGPSWQTLSGLAERYQVYLSAGSVPESDENGNVYVSPKEPMYKRKEDVPDLYHESEVVVDSVTTKHTAPPKLLDLAGLSSILSSKGIKASEVLQTYQNLYEHQIVSYPRTEDKSITPEQFQEMLPKINQIAVLVGVDPSLLTHTQMRPTHVKKGGTHGANRPGPNVPSSLSTLDRYVCRRLYLRAGKRTSGGLP